MGFLFVLGAARVAIDRFRDGPARLVACCAAAGLGLFYSYPLLSFTLQFATTVLVPLGLLAAYGIAPWVTRLRGASPVVAVALLVLNAPTSFVVMRRVLREVECGDHRIETARLDAYAELEKLTQPGDVVLSGFRDANRIPRFCARRVYCGYLFATVDYNAKMNEVFRYFQASSAAQRASFVRERGIDWVFIDPRDPQVGRFDAAADPRLRVRFANEVATIAEVTAR